MTVSATTAIGGVSRSPSYCRARYYNPTTGRFLSEDPIEFLGGFNLYDYARNNPLSFKDPFGLCASDSNKECKAALQEILKIGLIVLAIAEFMMFFPIIAAMLEFFWIAFFLEMYHGMDLARGLANAGIHCISNL